MLIVTCHWGFVVVCYTARASWYICFLTSTCLSQEESSYSNKNTLLQWDHIPHFPSTCQACSTIMHSPQQLSSISGLSISASVYRNWTCLSNLICNLLCKIFPHYSNSQQSLWSITCFRVDVESIMSQTQTWADILAWAFLIDAMALSNY